jgi:tRNA(His) 5'-end guanylyltransferase
MKTDDLGARMRALECFHSLRLLPGAWAIVRVDGRGFSQLTESRFEKPFDERVHAMMVRTAQALLEELHGVYAATHSDEISVLLRPEWELFDREWEKLVSLSAGIASAAFTQAAGSAAHFDSRVWLGATADLVVDYFRWRQSDAARCALNGWCYWTLRGTGLIGRQAEHALNQKGFAEKHELLFQHGINFNDVPAWQRRGAGLYWEAYEREAFNPHTGQPAMAQRRRIRVEEELPMKEAFARLLGSILGSPPGESDPAPDIGPAGEQDQPDG